MTAMASQSTSLTIAYSIVCLGADQSKHQSPASIAFVCGIHRGPVNTPHKGPVTQKMFPFDDVIMSKKLKSEDRWTEKKKLQKLASLSHKPRSRGHDLENWFLGGGFIE